MIDKNKDGSLAWRHLAKADKGRRGDERPNVGRSVTLTLEADGGSWREEIVLPLKPDVDREKSTHNFSSNANYLAERNGSFFYVLTGVVVTKDRRFYNFRHLNDAANDYELDSKDELAVVAASGNELLPQSETTAEAGTRKTELFEFGGSRFDLQRFSLPPER
ncbi:hypothetical protein CEXT_99081, partial [Caerostris extrusa]